MLSLARMREVFAAPPPGSGRVIRVGPRGDVATIAAAARAARDGDVVEVQAGEYRGDVAVWRQHALTIRVLGGRARLVADGRHAQGKGIWVIRNGDFVVEGFEFVGARVPDRNGAGIRLERGRLVVRDSSFLENECGILTSNHSGSELLVERCEFAGNGHGDGQSHHLYAGALARLEVRASHFRQGRVGHLLKSRARVSRILYNRLTDEAGGRASYELEFPKGGEVLALGNLIEQAASTENPTIVSCGAERYRSGEGRFVFAFNTVVNRANRPARFVRVRPGGGPVLVANNLWVGRGSLALPEDATQTGNFSVDEAAFRNPRRYDFAPQPGVGFIGKAVELRLDGAPLVPRFHRVGARELAPLAGVGALTPGAFQP